jgi:hypothetical protein
MTTSTNKTTTGLAIKKSVKVAKPIGRRLVVRSGVKAGGLNGSNHGRRLVVRSGVKAGGLNGSNHNRALALV